MVDHRDMPVLQPGIFGQQCAARIEFRITLLSRSWTRCTVTDAGRSVTDAPVLRPTGRPMDTVHPGRFSPYEDQGSSSSLSSRVSRIRSSPSCRAKPSNPAVLIVS